MSPNFTKLEALGNDLILVDAAEHAIADPAKLAAEICDRHFGVGSDGLLLIERGAEGLPLMRMYNPDGTEDFCGNGLRCVIAWLAERAGQTKGEITMLSARGRHHAFVRRLAPRKYHIDIEVLAPRFHPAEIPAKLPGERVMDHPLKIGAETWRISSVSLGTTHTVILVEDLPDEVFHRVSPLIERHPIFPERTSVIWCHVESLERIRARIWERGVGETLACGTGACAVLAICRTLGCAADSAEIVSRGGTAECRWTGRGPVRLAGPARVVYSGQWNGESGK